MKTADYQQRFDLSPDAIAQVLNDIVRLIETANDRVASVPLDSVTFENSAQVLMDVDVALMTRMKNLAFLFQTSPDSKVRAACASQYQRFIAVEAAQSMRVDVYKVLKTLTTDSVAMAALSPEPKRYIERRVRELERNGLQLDEPTRNRLAHLQEKILTLAVKFGENMSEETTELYFTAEELEGVSTEFLAGLPKTEDGMYKVVLSLATGNPIRETCAVPETRRRVETAFERRCITSNTQILEQLVSLRHEKANLLGYETHAAFKLETLMAKTPETVNKFLTEISDRLTPLADREKQNLLKLKEDECARRGLPFDGKLNFWDVRYYKDQFIKANYAIDNEKIREFFPLDHVTTTLLSMYETLLSLSFAEVENPHVWHEDVRKFAVKDARSGREGQLLGYFYMDMHPRPGKFKGGACMILIDPCVDSMGNRVLPEAALVVNLRAPTAERPSILSHDEVLTFSHEFGHLMHTICSEATAAKFGTDDVERDFLEAPSQMLENWCWERDTLRQLSRHYVTHESLPGDVIDRIISARKANIGITLKQQIARSLFDQFIYSRPVVDTAAAIATFFNDIVGIEVIPDTNYAASFIHMADGYDAQYYGYLWSEVFSADMFLTRFKKEGLLNPTTGLAYRESILRPGATKDASEMLREFLGREPTQDAFLASLGLVNCKP